jgi:hypothetical protein
MVFETEYAAVGDPPPRSAARALGRLYLGQSYRESVGVVESVNAQMVFAPGLGYATNVFPSSYAEQSPAKYVEQKVTDPYGPAGQPISSITGAG